MSTRRRHFVSAIFGLLACAGAAVVFGGSWGERDERDEPGEHGEIPRHAGASGASGETPDLAKTRAYVASIDIRAIERRGCDLFSPRYDPARIGKPLHEIDNKTDYDWSRLDEVRVRLRGVDRRAALKHVFDQVTAGAGTATDVHLAILGFLHRATRHNDYLRPIARDGTQVTDPLTLLELNEMRCGQVARVAVDLFEAGGYPGRLVHLGSHMIAEVHYGGAWHFLDADSAGGAGLTLRNDDGTIPSVVEISRRPEWLDTLPCRFEPYWDGTPLLAGSPVLSSVYFPGPDPRQRYSLKSPGTSPGVSPGVEGTELRYGWRRPLRADADWNPGPGGPPRHQPGAVRWRRAVVAREPAAAPVARLAWDPAHDADGDLVGYRVFVGSTSRGWQYRVFGGSDETRAFWAGDAGWSPDMYDAMFRPPPSDVAMRETAETQITIELPGDRAVFVTIMAYDAYGERNGRTLGLMSNELRLEGSRVPD